ncbi:MAG: acetylxylan esterase [Candidatus Hydrogenedentes bacterium]|nr:acetylxylan esterase [Candidatus Hydrogenedentota bacterium]
MNLSLLLLALLAQPPAPDAFPQRYLEPIEQSFPLRQEQYNQVGKYVQEQIAQAPAKRAQFFQPDYSSPEAYRASTVPLREALCRRIGFPPPGVKEGTEARYEPVAEDGYSTIYRMRLEVLDGVEVYGILWIPKDLQGKAPLLICQHGGGGNPELIGTFQGDAEHGVSNYGWMVQRGLQAGFVCWAPALLFPYGGKEPIEGPDRKALDRQLKQVGTSILGLELYKLKRGLDEVLKRPEVDAERVGMMGLSYGGAYTLYFAAVDERIDAAVSSCYFNRREDYGWEDWSFFNHFNEFADPEICGLICPRALIVEVGEKDDLFNIDGARATAPQAAAHWEKLGLQDRFRFATFPGGHEFWGDGAYEFVKANLRE